MFCEKCGLPLEPGSKFCSSCGAQISQSAPQQPAQNTQAPTQNPQSAPQQPAPQQSAPPQMQTPPAAPEQTPVTTPSVQPTPVGQAPEQTPKMPKKKKFPKKLLVGGISVVAAAAIVLTTVFNWGTITNFFKKTFSSKEDYFASVNAQAFSSFTGTVNSMVPNLDWNNSSVSADFGIELGDKTMSLLNTAMKASGADIDIQWIQSVLNKTTFGYEMILKDKKMELIGTVKLSGQALLTMDVVADFENSVMVMTIPELNSQGIEMPMPDMDLVAYDDFRASLGQLQQLASVFSSERILPLMDRYLQIVLGEIKEVDQESVELKVQGVKQKCTAYTAEIDEKVVKNAALAVVKQAQNDNELKQIIRDLCTATDLNYADTWSEFSSALKEAESDIKSSQMQSFSFDYVSYVDGTGEIIGVELNVEGVEIYSRTARSGGKIGMEIGFSAQGAKVEYAGKGTESGSKLSGDFTMSYEKYGTSMDYFTVTYKDWDTKSAKEGRYNGSMEVALSKQVMNMMIFAADDSGILSTLFADFSVKMDFNSPNANETGVKLSFLTKGDTVIAFSVSAKISAGKDITVPTGNVSIDDDEAGERWAQTALNNIPAILDKLKAAGVPAGLLDMNIDELGDLFDSPTSGRVPNSAPADDWWDDDDDDYWGGYWDDDSYSDAIAANPLPEPDGSWNW